MVTEVEARFEARMLEIPNLPHPDVPVGPDESANVVVRTEDRKHPGLVVQGDRLREWFRLARAADPTSIELLADQLSRSIAEYDRVCRRQRKESHHRDSLAGHPR